MSTKLVGIGEVLWDLLPGGRQLGGAPANFAYHACALGAEAHILSRVGGDEPGRELLGRLEQLGILIDAVEIDTTAPTGTVTVEIKGEGQPQFTIHEDVAWDRIAGQAAGRRAVAAANAVCFGTLAQRGEVSRRSVRELLRDAPAESLRILDVNLRKSYYSREIIEESLALANILKVNETELEVLAEMFNLCGDNRGRIAELARRFELRLVACTHGERGSLLHSEGHWSEHPGVPVKAAVDAVAASSLAYGFRQPIVVDEDGVIIVGHTRYKAALKLGLKEVPVHVAVGLTPAQAKAYRIADNQTATLSSWETIGCRWNRPNCKKWAST